MRLSRLSVVAAAAAAAAFGACSSRPPPVAQAPAPCKPQAVQLSVIASPKINRDDDGHPHPVQLRVYQLKSDGRMLGASFDDVWKDDKSTLKDDLVKVDEVSIYPDTRTEVKFERDEAAHFVVAAALFRDPLGRSWWTEFELAPPDPATCASGGPHLAVWVDQSRVSDGADHIDEHPSGGGPTRELFLRFDPQAPGRAGGEPRNGGSTQP